MTDGSRRVVAGVDAHTDEHHAAVLDESGRLLGTAAFPATRDGYEQLIAWVAEHGLIERIGVESTGSLGASETLCTRLALSCESVLEVGVESGEAFVPAGHGAFPVALVVSDREVDELTG
jgi:transposase